MLSAFEQKKLERVTTQLVLDLHQQSHNSLQIELTSEGQDHVAQAQHTQKIKPYLKKLQSCLGQYNSSELELLIIEVLKQLHIPLEELPTLINNIYHQQRILNLQKSPHATTHRKLWSSLSQFHMTKAHKRIEKLIPFLETLRDAATNSEQETITPLLNALDKTNIKTLEPFTINPEKNHSLYYQKFLNYRANKILNKQVSLFYNLSINDLKKPKGISLWDQHMKLKRLMETTDDPKTVASITILMQAFKIAHNYDVSERSLQHLKRAVVSTNFIINQQPVDDPINQSLNPNNHEASTFYQTLYETSLTALQATAQKNSRAAFWAGLVEALLLLLGVIIFTAALVMMATFLLPMVLASATVTLILVGVNISTLPPLLIAGFSGSGLLFSGILLLWARILGQNSQHDHKKSHDLQQLKHAMDQTTLQKNAFKLLQDVYDQISTASLEAMNDQAENSENWTNIQNKIQTLSEQMTDYITLIQKIIRLKKSANKSSFFSHFFKPTNKHTLASAITQHVTDYFYDEGKLLKNMAVISTILKFSNQLAQLYSQSPHSLDLNDFFNTHFKSECDALDNSIALAPYQPLIKALVAKLLLPNSFSEKGLDFIKMSQHISEQSNPLYLASNT